MSVWRLVSVFGPGNVMAALSAVRWRESQQGRDTVGGVVTIVHTPGLPATAATESAVVVERLISSQGWETPMVLTDGDVDGIVQGANHSPYREVLRRFRQRVGREHFDEVYFAHDVVGRLPELAMNAYPNAERITYGDALGSVYDKRYHLALATGTSPTEGTRPRRGWLTALVRNGVKSVRRNATRIALGAPLTLQATSAILVLPMDQTGDCLSGKQLWVVPKSVVQSIIADCNRAVPELRLHTQDLLAGTPQPRYLILLENLSDGGFTSLEREAALYEGVVRSHAAAGATIVIKEHPQAVAPIGDVLARRIETEYVVRKLAPALRRHPVELWEDLVRSCQPISISYPCISLRFLYGRRVIYPVDDNLIETYFPPEYWKSYMNADRLYRGQMASLDAWDGKSILWRGTRE